MHGDIKFNMGCLILLLADFRIFHIANTESHNQPKSVGIKGIRSRSHPNKGDISPSILLCEFDVIFLDIDPIAC